MGFKKVYEDEKCSLYVTGLVKCNVCGLKDELGEKAIEVEDIMGIFVSGNNFEEFGNCEICGSQDWQKYAEHCVLGFPNFATGSDCGRDLFLTVQEIVDSNSDFTDKLLLAKRNGFRVHSILQNEKSIVLWKD